MIEFKDNKPFKKKLYYYQENITRLLALVF